VNKLPFKLKFISTVKLQLGESFMLIQVRGHVAYRVQMVDKPTVMSSADGSRPTCLADVTICTVHHLNSFKAIEDL
jgi:hypothetical protein